LEIFFIKLNNKEWFTGLTKCFLSIKIPKILLLASSDRMDKELTIAQMQGKFRLAIINDVGHIIHEDDSKEVAKMIADFILIFKIWGKISEMKPIVGMLGTSNSNFKKYEEFK